MSNKKERVPSQEEIEFGIELKSEEVLKKEERKEAVKPMLKELADASKKYKEQNGLE